MYGINGLIYLENYISQVQHDSLIEKIDTQTWDTGMKRRVQHYGYRYDYKARKVTKQMYLGNLPDWLESLAKQLGDDGLIQAVPDQVIVNEYQPGQGISAHIDCQPCFGQRIFSLSLGSAIAMKFTRVNCEKIEILLAPRSLIMMYSEARHHWKHEIPARKQDNGIKRTRRISLTFRTVEI